MRIACPACHAAYEVPDALIGAGRMLRCAKCGQEWMVSPDSTARSEAPPQGSSPAAAAPPAPALPSLAPPGPRPSVRAPQLIDPPLEGPAERRTARFALLVLGAAWIGSGLLLAALAAGAWMYRGPIAEAWPPAARLYLWLGAPVTG